MAQTPAPVAGKGSQPGCDLRWGPSLQEISMNKNHLSFRWINKAASRNGYCLSGPTIRLSLFSAVDVLI